MEFGFRDGDRRPRRPSPDDRRFTPPQAGPFHGEPPPSTFELEAAERDERIIREEVERRLIEKEVRRDLALARTRFHGGFGPVPFVVPPPPPGPFMKPDGPSTPPMPLLLMPVGMHPNCPPTALFGSWEGFGPRRLPGFGQPMLPDEIRTRPLPPPKPTHQLQLREIAPSQSSEVLSSETKASGVKRKADVSSATTKPTKLQNASSATTEPTKLQTAAKDWSCALCQVSATSEAGLNQHLEGKKHKSKLVQCGAIKVTDTDKSSLQVTTGNNNGAGPSDAGKKIHILVDGEMHPVVQKSNCVWCERCRVSCTNNAAMADHLRGKKHSSLNKVWTSIKAVRMNNKIKEDSVATCETDRKVTENGPTGIPEEDHCKEEDIDMAEEVDANSPNVIPVEIKEETDTASRVDENYAGETKKEGTDVDVAMDANKNFLMKVHQKSRNKVNKNFLWKVHQKSRKKTNKKFLFKVHQRSRKKTNKIFQFKGHQNPKKKANRWLGIREVNENRCIGIPAVERHTNETTDGQPLP